MDLKQSTEGQPVGVIGAGSFGMAIANLLAINGKVLLYVRRADVMEKMLANGESKGVKIHENVTLVNDPEDIGRNCTLIFPMVPSKNFRAMMRDFSPFLTPRHLLIHGTKGLDLQLPGDWKDGEPLDRAHVKTMSEVIREESVVVRVGVLAGPNLSKELAKGLPAGSVIASRFDEVIKKGIQAIGSARFRVYENKDLRGVEMAGVLKNILAIGSGMVSGLELGENARALMITRGWRELMRVAEIFGSDRNAFMGLAGIGDLVATCSSPLSRNYSLGMRLAKGESLEQVIESMDEVAEGVNTIRLAYGLSLHYKIYTPLINSFFHILYRNTPIMDAISGLMVNPLKEDVDFR
ncbi:MAG: NAD(P)-dependent glycerol-3-phosphate dehydrogenase [Bacteroidia bacterium]|nr:NAD(P)-dependent glycerol-3-phosphate dehydrogenase [Bacteroidia bacterium]